MKVKRIINTPVSSNTYVIQSETYKECFIIDPGSKDSVELINYLKINDLSPKYVIFTHSHFDHVWGIEELLKCFKPKVICSKECFKRISKPENYFNLLYYNKADYFLVNNVDVKLEQETTIILNDNEITIIPTPGHTDGCISVVVNDNIFLGDSLILGAKPILKRKYGASLEQLRNSLNSLYNRFPFSIVYPGHGDIFSLKDGMKWFETINNFL